MECPCWNCIDRIVACHVDCKAYKRYKDILVIHDIRHRRENEYRMISVEPFQRKGRKLYSYDGNY